MTWLRSSKTLCFAAIATLTLGSTLAGAQEYPLEIEHALGTTVLTKKPERIATVAWANHEIPLALGVVPVGFGDDNGSGLLPWVEAKFEELEVPLPALFDEGDGIDFEAVAASLPDVILAAYSGLSQSDYDTLSQIAPVVAYFEGPWATDWRDMISLNSAGMGMAEEGQALIDQLEVHPLTSRLPAVEHGAIVLLGSTPLGAAANPTPMSIPWLLDDYADLLSEAARQSE